VLLHPPPLACAVRASYGEMSRRSGFAAEADNHSDIAPFSIYGLPAVKDQTCKFAATSYRFSHRISIQQFTRERSHVATRIVSDR
jgi:hypothetical protein